MGIYKEKIRQHYTKAFQSEPLIIRSPGRINIIGEHTDYNMGFVLPAAIDKSIFAAMGKRDDDRIMLVALDNNDHYECAVDTIKLSQKHWPDYILGVVVQLQNAGNKVGGFNCVIGGDVPIGAGLSSSAAVECAVIFGLDKLFDLKLDKLNMVKMAQKAENEFVGVNCGIMDQFASVMGKEHSVMRLDCRSLEYTYHPFETNEYQLLLLDSGVKHSLGNSEYNTRRKECEEAVRILQKDNPAINSLRDVDIETLHTYKSMMPSTPYKRAKYVVEENRRVLKVCEALPLHDWETVGEKMYETHEGLRHDYAVSCDELDYLVDYTKTLRTVLGARMMGGGFGGCTINLIQATALPAFIEAVSEDYKKKFGITLKVYPVNISQGTSIA